MPNEPGVGSRGGPVPAMTVHQAHALFRQWMTEEYGKLRLTILMTAYQQGEFHADMLRDVELSQRNMIGANVNALVSAKLMVSTGEHRKGASEASHGRRSYVYRLTKAGTNAAEIATHSRWAEQTPVDPNAHERLF